MKSEKTVFPPYYIIDYGFYKIIYDDNLVKTIKTKATWDVSDNAMEVDVITSGIAGIIKSTHGMCKREGKEPYTKDWTSEKEVRLKIGVNTNNEEIKRLGIYARQMAINLSDDAFLELPIKFSPDMDKRMRKKVMDKLNGLLLYSNIYEI